MDRSHNALKEFIVSIGIPKIIVKLYSLRQYKKIIYGLDLKNPKNVLDVGGREGTLTSLIKKQIGKARFTLLDIEDFNVKEKLGIKFIKGNAEKIPFRTKEFDLVICKDVLHHCQNPKRAIREIKRVGKRRIIIEARRGDKWLDHFLDEHNHFTETEFKKLVKPKKFYYIDVLWPCLKIMIFLLLIPIIPKSKKAFMVGIS